jgi:hypothetical protein
MNLVRVDDDTLDVSAHRIEVPLETAVVAVKFAIRLGITARTGSVLPKWIPMLLVDSPFVTLAGIVGVSVGEWVDMNVGDGKLRNGVRLGPARWLRSST